MTHASGSFAVAERAVDDDRASLGAGLRQSSDGALLLSYATLAVPGARRGMHAQSIERVLFLPSWYPSPANTVLGTFVQEHARACALRFDTVVVYLYEAGSDEADEATEHLREGVREVMVPFRLGRNRHLFGAIYARTMMSAFRRFLRGWTPDVVHVHVGYPAGLGGLLAAARWRRPVVYTEQAGPLEEKILASRPARLVVPALARAARMGAPVSRFLEDDMRKAGILPRRSMVLANAVDLTLFHPPLEPGRRGGPTRLLAAALLVPGKGLECAVDAVATLRSSGVDVELSLAGDGPLRAELGRRAREAGVDDHVHFLGLLTKPDVAIEMRRHDVFVMASERETFSAVVVEAMASGLPVVATRCGGPDELIVPGTGLLVDVGDTSAVAAAILAIAAAPEAFADGPTIARSRFGHDAVADRLAEIYAAAVA